MIFDMGASATKLYIVERGLVHLSHTINRGSQDITANIARTLNISIEEAEVIKRSVGMGKTIDGVDLSETVTLLPKIYFQRPTDFCLIFKKRKQEYKVCVFNRWGISSSWF